MEPDTKQVYGEKYEPSPNWTVPIVHYRPRQFHVETLAFELGLKKVLRLEDIPVHETETTLAPFIESSCHYVLAEENYTRNSYDPNWRSLKAGESALTYAFIARSEEDVRLAKELDAVEKLSGSKVDDDTRRKATIALGQLYGYPECCTEAFLEIDNRGDNRQWPKWIAAHSEGNYPFFMNNLQYFETMLYFFPCRYDCPKAIGRIRQLYQHLQMTTPNFADSLNEALRSFVLYVSWYQYLLFDGQMSPSGELQYTAVRHPGQYRKGLLKDEQYCDFILMLLGAVQVGNRIQVKNNSLEIYNDDKKLAKFILANSFRWWLLDFTGC